MKAIRVHKYGGVGQLKFEDDVIIPEPDENGVLVRMIAAGVNPIDTYIRQGAFAHLPDLPFIPGFDGAGIVENVGDRVKTIKVGDRVFVSRNARGTYAQFCAVSEDSCFPLPEHLTYEQGAAIGIPYFTAYRALFQKARVHRGQHILIHGASGAVGLAACQLAKNAGLKVHGTAGSQPGLDIVKHMGHADYVQNHNEKDYFKKLLADTPDELGFDVIVEMLANANLSHDLTLLKQNGTVIVVGSRGQAKIDPRDMMSKETTVMGMALFTSSKEDWQDIIKHVLIGLQEHKLNPVVGKIYNGLEEAPTAQTDIMQAGHSKGKLVIKVDH